MILTSLLKPLQCPSASSPRLDTSSACRSRRTSSTLPKVVGFVGAGAVQVPTCCAALTPSIAKASFAASDKEPPGSRETFSHHSRHLSSNGLAVGQVYLEISAYDLAPVVLPNRSRNLTQASAPFRVWEHSFTICFARPVVSTAYMVNKKSHAAATSLSLYHLRLPSVLVWLARSSPLCKLPTPSGRPLLHLVHVRICPS